MADIKVGDCFYNHKIEELIIVTAIDDDNYEIDIIQKWNRKNLIEPSMFPSKGFTRYPGWSIAKVYYFSVAIKIDSNIYAKIIKLLEINNLVCSSILREAPKLPCGSEESDVWLGNKYAYTDIHKGDESVDFNEHSLEFHNCKTGSFMLYRVPNGYYDKIYEQCNKTFELIDSIWPNLN